MKTGSRSCVLNGCASSPDSDRHNCRRAGLGLGHGVDLGGHADAVANLTATRPAEADTDTAGLGMRQLSLDHPPGLPAVGPGADGDHGV